MHRKRNIYRTQIFLCCKINEDWIILLTGSINPFPGISFWWHRQCCFLLSLAVELVIWLSSTQWNMSGSDEVIWTPSKPLPPHTSSACPPCSMLHAPDPSSNWWKRTLRFQMKVEPPDQGAWVPETPAAQKHPCWTVMWVRNRLMFWNLFATSIPSIVSLPQLHLGRLWARGRLLLTQLLGTAIFLVFPGSSLVPNTNQLPVGDVALPVCGSWSRRVALPTDLPNP